MAPQTQLDERVPAHSPRKGEVIGGMLLGLTAAAVLLSADVHFELWANNGFKDVHTIGPLFLLNAIGGLVIALVMLMWRHWLPVLAAVGFGVATLIAFWISITAGLFGLKEQASGTPQVIAEVAEIIAVVGGALLLLITYTTRKHARIATRATAD